MPKAVQGKSLTAGLTGLQRDGLPGVRRWRRLPGRRFVIIHSRRRGRVDIDAAAEDERRQEHAQHTKSHARIVYPSSLRRQRRDGVACAATGKKCCGSWSSDSPPSDRSGAVPIDHPRHCDARSLQIRVVIAPGVVHTRKPHLPSGQTPKTEKGPAFEASPWDG